MKKTISVLFTLALVLTCICVFSTQAGAATLASGTCGDNLTWTLEDSGTLTISGTGPMNNYKYSSDVPWYNRRSRINTVIISDGVTTISNSAFYNCTYLTAVTIPNSITTIGKYVFANCTSLTDVYITDPNAWCKIQFGDSYYANPMYDADRLHILDEAGNEVTQLVLGSDVTTIPAYAFRKCTSLRSVTIPDSVTTIGGSAFHSCTGLRSVTIPDSVTTIGSYAFTNCENLTDVYITDPDAWCKISFSNSVQANPMYYADRLHILDEAGDEVTEVVLGSDVTAIPAYAFRNCKSLRSVTIPDSVTTIGAYAFFSCTALRSVAIGGGVTGIGAHAFFSCINLMSVSIPDSATFIGGSAFEDCYALTSVTIGDGVTTINKWAFCYCDNLENVYYAGTDSQWEAISIGAYNTDLTGATIRYQHVHDYSLFPPVTVAATCTEVGYVEYTCAYGETYRETLPELPHSYPETGTVVAPTCTKDGYTNVYCTSCGAVRQKDIVAALGHDRTGPVKVIAPTCIAQGYTYIPCTRCDVVKDSYDIVPALGHDYTGLQTVVEVTCTTEGYTNVSCTRCDSIKKTEVVAALGHKMALAPAVEPTCTEPGLTAGTCCERCQLVGIAQTQVPATGHSFVQGVCTACGELSYVPGDLDGKAGVNEGDAIYLLRHILMPDIVSVDQPVDYDGDGKLTTDDVICLLQHILMPNLFPL